MGSLIRTVGCLTFAMCAGAQSFEVASIKPASPDARGITCGGGPGTSDPGLWTCSNVPLGFLIYTAYGFQPYQFRPTDPCCQARFDVTARVPPGTTREQFLRMQQSLLEERFKLKLRREPREVPIYELTVGPNGPKLKAAAPDAAPARQDPWEIPTFTMGKDGYPEFPPGGGGVAGGNGHYRWLESNLSMEEIAKTLSFYLGRPVVDATRLKGNYDVDMRWTYDLAWLLERAGHKEDVANLPDTGPAGPTLERAIQNQLGLKLNSKKGVGEAVVIEHVEKVPIEN